MLVKAPAGRAWAAKPYPGIERALFRKKRVRQLLVAGAAGGGCALSAHSHHGTEEVVVMAGQVRIGGIELAAGDYLFTEPGEEHDVVAVTAAVIFVSSQRSTPVVE
jgi:quercetin dioxygenase-like cupin family protein